MKKYLLLSLCLLSSLIKGQNLIPNPGFEEHDTTANLNSQWNICTSWSNANNHPYLTYPYGSPDYLNTVHKTQNMHLPNSIFGYVNPHTGNAIMGLCGFHSSEEFREYISCKLTQPMKVGTRYKISFWITNGEKNRYGDAGCNHMGAKLSVNQLKQDKHEALKIDPTVEIKEVFFSESWKQFSFDFIADSAYANFIFGNFYSDENTKRSKTDSNSFKKSVYYFIDDISIISDEPLAIIYSVPPNDSDMTASIKFISPLIIDEENIDTNQNTNQILIYSTTINQIPTIENDTTVIPEQPNFTNINLVNVTDSINVKVYPNPATNQVFISCDENFIYYMFGSDGKLLFTGRKNNEVINVSQLAVGSYLLKIVTEKFIVTRIVQVVR